MDLQDPVSKHMTRNPVCVQQDSELADAVELITEYNIRHLPVLDGDKLVGLVSERDMGLIESLLPVEWGKISVAEAMTPEPFSVRADATIGKVARGMATERYGSAVVLNEDDKVVGIFTTVDGMRVLALACGETLDE